MRDRKQVKKLGVLEFMSNDITEEMTEEKKKPSKFEMLQKRIEK